MSFREFLKNMGLEKEKVDEIMAEYGEQTTKNLTTISELKTQVSALQEQVNKAPNTEELQGKIDELTAQVTSLTNEKETLETNQKETVKKLKLDYALNAAIAKSNPIDEVAYKAHLDMAKIGYDDEKNELTGFEEQDKAIRETNGYLFQEFVPDGQEHGGLAGKGSQSYSLTDAIADYYK